MGHKIRQISISAAFDVEALTTNAIGEQAFKTPDELVEEFTKFCAANGWYVSTPIDIQCEEINGDDLNTFENPAGFIAPDGKIFLEETSVSPLVHMGLARRVHQAYAHDLEPSFFPERVLEEHGFIKVHGCDVYFFAAYDVLPTRAQLQTLCDYSNRFGYLEINDEGKYFRGNDFLAMDDIQVKTHFSL